MGFLQGTIYLLILIGMVIGEKGTIISMLVALIFLNPYNICPFIFYICMIVFVILEYKFVENKYCQGSVQGGYLTLEDAKVACNRYAWCGTITFSRLWNVPKGYYSLCNGIGLEPSTVGINSWVKHNFSEFCLIYD